MLLRAFAHQAVQLLPAHSSSGSRVGSSPRSVLWKHTSFTAQPRVYCTVVAPVFTRVLDWVRVRIVYSVKRRNERLVEMLLLVLNVGQLLHVQRPGCISQCCFASIPGTHFNVMFVFPRQQNWTMFNCIWYKSIISMLPSCDHVVFFCVFVAVIMGTGYERHRCRLRQVHEQVKIKCCSLSL